MRLFIGFFVGLFLAAGILTSVHAQNPTIVTDSPESTIASSFREGEVVTVRADEVIDRDFFGAGERVEIYGTVNGDVYAAGGHVVVSGTVGGDVLAVGGNVTIAGLVAGDIRVAGGNIMVTGSVSRSATLLGGNITIADPGTVSGNLVVAGGNVEVAAPIAGNIVTGAGGLLLSSLIGGDAEVWAGTLRVAPTAEISGNLAYAVDERADIDPSARIGGQIVEKTPFDMAHDMSSIGEDEEKEFVGFFLALKAVSFLAAVVVGILIVKVAPEFTRRLGKPVGSSPWKSLGIGFLALILSPIAGVILLITVIGAPVGIFILVAYGISIYLAKFPVALWIGGKLGKKINKSMGLYSQVFLGLVIYYLLTLIPILGGLVQFIALLIGLGALAMTKYSIYASLKTKKLI